MKEAAVGNARPRSEANLQGEGGRFYGAVVNRWYVGSLSFSESVYPPGATVERHLHSNPYFLSWFKAATEKLIVVASESADPPRRSSIRLARYMKTAFPMLAAVCSDLKSLATNPMCVPCLRYARPRNFATAEPAA